MFLEGPVSLTGPPQQPGKACAAWVSFKRCAKDLADFGERAHTVLVQNLRNGWWAEGACEERMEWNRKG